MAKRTPLYEKHRELQARLVDFAGWEMPVQYPTGILQEHAATRERAGLFDTCHMGEFLIEAADVRHALNCALAGNFAKVKDGRERYTFIVQDDGGVVDDAVVMIFSEQKAWIVVNAGDIDGDFEFVAAHLPAGASAENLTATTAKLDVQGPRAWEVVKRVTGRDLRAMPFYSFVEMEWQGQPLVFSRSGYTGEPGAELYLDAGGVGELWAALLEAGRSLGLTPCGLGARDTLRLEAGMPLYGHELTRERNPLQAGMAKFISLDKPEDSPGHQALAAYAENPGETEVLVGLKMNDKRVPRPGFAVLSGGEKIGAVTSGAPGPTVGCPLALAYVKPDHAEPDSVVDVEIRGKPAGAVVVKLPFYSNPMLRKKAEG